MKTYMNYKKVLLSTLIASAAIGLTSTGVFAEETTVKGELKEARCTRVTTRVNNLTTRLTNGESARQNRHQKVIDRLNAIITRVEAAGLNADKLKSDVTTLGELKTTWQNEYTSLLTKLDATKQYACGQSEGQFVQAVKDARAQRKVMHDANLEFWKFVKNTVKPDIRAIRGQLKSTSNK